MHQIKELNRFRLHSTSSGVSSKSFGDFKLRRVATAKARLSTIEPPEPPSASSPISNSENRRPKTAKGPRTNSTIRRNENTG